MIEDSSGALQHRPGALCSDNRALTDREQLVISIP
jgi:hypothetical protein